MSLVIKKNGFLHMSTFDNWSNCNSSGTPYIRGETNVVTKDYCKIYRMCKGPHAAIAVIIKMAPTS